MSMLPPAPVDDGGLLLLTSADIAATLAGGLVGYCGICRLITVTWWDLSACDLEPVVGRDGVLTDQIALHGACIRGVVDYWVSMDAGPGDDERGDGTEDSGDLPDGSPPADPVTRTRPSGRDRRALLGGVYGGTG